MKIALNASARDAQIRDSFNKESFAATHNNDVLVTVCKFLFDLQSQLPRNASKLHSLVVVDDKNDPCYLLNFEVLRSSMTVMGDDSLVAFCLDEQPEKKVQLSTKKRVSNTEEKGVKENDN